MYNVSPKIQFFGSEPWKERRPLRLRECRFALDDGDNLQLPTLEHLLHHRQAQFQQAGRRLATGFVSILCLNRLPQRATVGQ